MKPLIRSILALLCLLLSAHADAQKATPTTLDKHRVDTTKLQDGDLVFIRSHTRNAKAISDVTQSNFTHCGIAFNEGGTWKVREGAGMGSKYLDIDQWQDKESTDYMSGEIKQYEPITVFRLADIKNWPEKERNENLTKLRTEAKKLHETMYDFGFAWNNHYSINNEGDHYSSNSDDKEYVYCSELIYKAFDQAVKIQLGKLKKIKDYPLTDEAKQILDNPKGLKDRGDKRYDPEETVIAPQDISKSERLEPVIVPSP